MSKTTQVLSELMRRIVEQHGEAELLPDEIAADDDIYDCLGLDSLTAVALFVEVQRKFSVEIGPERFACLRSLHDIEAEIATILVRGEN